MSVSVDQFLSQVNEHPESIEFDQVMAVINENYDYSPARFTNGVGGAMAVNEAGTNEGSCKIFAFAQLHDLSVPHTLALFGKFYSEDVLRHPEAADHANIRNFIRSGWAGVAFDQQPLVKK